MLAGCAGTVPAAQSTRPSANPAPTTPAPTRVRPAPKPPRAATPLALPGLEAVIGSNAEQLTRLFGAPRLDIIEGDARKLQFSGQACVLDAYLYPPPGGGAPVTTYVDARRVDGRDMDRAGCVAALRQR